MINDLANEAQVGYYNLDERVEKYVKVEKKETQSLSVLQPSMAGYRVKLKGR